jgi:hypothetical protein
LGAPRRTSATGAALVLVHAPVHASWLNQIEIYFSIAQLVSPSRRRSGDSPACERRLNALSAPSSRSAASRRGSESSRGRRGRACRRHSLARRRQPGRAARLPARHGRDGRILHVQDYRRKEQALRAARRHCLVSRSPPPRPSGAGVGRGCRPRW